MAHAMTDATETRLQKIGLDIKKRIEKFNQLEIPLMAEFDALGPLMNEAVELCGKDAARFDKFAEEYCGDLGRSRLYELLAIQSGTKTVEDIRAANRARVAKHRRKKAASVTDKESVTLGGKKVDVDGWGADAKEQIAEARADANPTEATDDDAAPVEAAQDDEAETADESPQQQPQTSMTPEQALAAYKAAWSEHWFRFTREMHWNEALVWMQEQVEKQETPDDTATEPAVPTIEKIKEVAEAFAAKKAAANGNGVGREDSAPIT
jgi:hypothetical protein